MTNPQPKNDTKASILDQTDKLSTQIRQVAFAGIAIIWAFKLPFPVASEVTESLSLKSVLHSDLYYALWFFIIAISLDLFQYLFGTIGGINGAMKSHSKLILTFKLLAYLLLFAKFLSCATGYLYLFFYIF